jgi:SOS-response transcriptional repressor LexA
MPIQYSNPFFYLLVAVGSFSEAQSIEETRWYALPDSVRPSADLFVCQVIGESMNKVIPNGAYCLFRKYSGGSRNGQIVLVESSSIQDADYGSCYTIKEYESKKNEDADGWMHQSIVLKPLSTFSGYAPIVLEEEDLKEFRVIGVFVKSI